ncbi:monovalent cation:proton antiporter-2 (CPA2) family protein [Rhizobium halophytocola]|uniref:CPA2 family monovalent cation:H+ antiporter-2 n=1 Tax=Rhizobium halophytocola TaxID=735519 RepID=A0ABS4DXN3_9HYPH|nr:monovalent cation:proton antiporter-2 (CPA2) family protein [Rhizobium halophytocola]MBP1850448.1 CPA2 family monovalent cation:H+ antiporter-2 [Rhizobium halophytocola]
MSASHGQFYEILLLLGGAVTAAPIFRKLGLSTVLGYLAAGVMLGPIMHLLLDAESVFSVAELGVVFLLFIIGLELKPSRLWALKADIFALGTAQVVLSGLLLSALPVAIGLTSWRGGLVVGFGLALSSTAFAMQLLDDMNDRNTRYGQRAFSILLLQDLAIVPLLALVSLLGGHGASEAADPLWSSILIAVVTIIALIVAGRFLLTPLFQIIARTGAHEVMIAAALFVVLGSAMLMQAVGLSMAMGAFLAGVLLAESSYRHELEADIEPFRGILLALFFMAVGLSMDLGAILDNIALVIGGVVAVMVIKALVLYGLARGFGSSHNDAVRIGALLPQGGEFGFVLFTTASSAGLFSTSTTSVLISIVTLSMACTPLAALLSRRLLIQEPHEELEEDFDGAGADVLMIGFSRFGQIAAQILLASGREVTIIDNSADRVRQAASFGFRIYFGDGNRLDVLRAAGLERAKLVAVCTARKETTNFIVDMVRQQCPDARLFVRAYDRIHSLELRAKDIDFELRETLESGLLFGQRVLEGLGVSEEDAIAIKDDIRRRDEERLRVQATHGVTAGRDMLLNSPVHPEPLTKPKRYTEPRPESDEDSKAAAD